MTASDSHDDGDDQDYRRLFAWYSHRGCPGVGYDDNCGEPSECAAAGGCRILREERERGVGR